MPIKSTRVAVLFFSLFGLNAAHADNGVTIVYQEPLEQLQLAHAPPAGELKPGTATSSSLRFDAFGKRFDLALEVNRTLLGAAERASLPAGVEVYRGAVAGMPGSWARLVLANDVPRGVIWDGSELWAIEVAAGANAGDEQPYIFRLDDLQIAPGAMSCAHVSSAKTGGDFAKALMAEGSVLTAQAPGASSQIDLAIIGDFEFTSAKGASVDTALVNRMNVVDGIFSSQLGVQLNVNRIDTYTSNNDPFTDETDSGALLDELADFRSATSTQNANGLSHLFTGRNLDTTTVGVAFTGALCSRRFGAGLTQGTHNDTMDALIAAHEIGHNFGAPHDGTSGSPCESETGDFLMAPRLNGVDQFSSCSIDQMQDDVANASCISPLESTDLALIAGSQPAPVLLGNTATVTFDANNIGIDPASNVSVDVTIPPGVTFSAMSATSGTCSSGAGSASCAISSIAAGSGVTVTVTAATTAVGNIDFVASLSADADADAGNNQASVGITVDPAIDLVSTAAATAQVSLNQSTTIQPRIENRSSITATNVTLTVTPDAGIRIDSASWAPGSCNIASNTVTCQAGSLGPQASDLLQLGVTATSEGSLSYALAVNATEVDRDTGNNNANGQLNVGSSGGGAGGGGAEKSGGGSIEWLSVLALLLAALWSYSRRNTSLAAAR